jgi:broad specificity phosphatase PhoE
MYISGFFRDKHVDAIYSSPFKRVIQTAKPLATQKGLPILLAPEMCEFFHDEAIDYRDHKWETTQEIIKEFPAVRFHKNDLGENWYPTWPEQKENVRERVTTFYNEVISSYFNSDSVVSVFGHGATTGELKSIVSMETMNPCPNAAIFEYQIDSIGDCLAHKLYLEHLGSHTYNLEATAY